MYQQQPEGEKRNYIMKKQLAEEEFFESNDSF